MCSRTPNSDELNSFLERGNVTLGLYEKFVDFRESIIHATSMQLYSDDKVIRQHVAMRLDDETNVTLMLSKVSVSDMETKEPMKEYTKIRDIESIELDLISKREIIEMREGCVGKFSVVEVLNKKYEEILEHTEDIYNILSGYLYMLMNYCVVFQEMPEILPEQNIRFVSKDYEENYDMVFDVVTHDQIKVMKLQRKVLSLIKVYFDRLIADFQS